MSTLSAMGTERDIALAKGGDLEAWRRLCELAAPMLHAYLGARIQRPAVVERLTSQTLVSAWRHLGDAEITDIADWLRRLAAGAANTWAREHPLEAVHVPFPASLCPQLEQLRRMERLQRALTDIDEIQVRALELRYRGGLDEAEIAHILRLDPAAVATVLTAALVALDRADASLAANP